MGTMWRCFVGILCLAMIACSHSQDSEQKSAQRQSPPPTLEQLDARLKKLENHTALLAAEGNNAHIQPASISCSQPGYYSVAETKLGPFPVGCEKATPYLNGYRVHLRIDNLTSVSFRDFQIEINYGGKEVRQTLMNDLYPGHTTYTDVNLTPATVDDLNLLLVTLTPTTIGTSH